MYNRRFLKVLMPAHSLVDCDVLFFAIVSICKRDYS